MSRPASRSWAIVAAALLGAAPSLGAVPASSPPPAPPIPDIPEEFANAPAVVLEDTTTWTIAADGTSARTIRERILLRKREGFEKADRAISYHTGTSQIRNFRARTVRADGTVVSIPSDLQRDSILFKDVEDEYRVLQFTFPAVEVGAILECEYELAYTGPRRWTWWELQRDVPVLEARFVTRALPPAKEELVLGHYERTDTSKWCEDLRPSKEGKQERRETVCRNVPAFEDETRSPPEVDVRARILMTWDHGPWAFLHEKVWGSMNISLWDRVGKFTEPRAKVKALADQLAPPGTPFTKVVDRVYSWVKKNMKVREGAFSDSLGASRGEAETIDQVLERGGGKPEDVTMLTWALLREASITAHPVLVGDRSEQTFMFGIPDWNQADHLMLQVLTGKETGYLDPSCRFCQVGIPDWRHCGGVKSGIRIDGQRIPWTVDVPAIGGEFNSERRVDRAILGEDGTGRVEGSVTYYGQREADWRERNSDLSAVARLDEFLKSVGGDIEDASVTIPDPEAIDENVKIDYRYTRRHMARAVGEHLLVRPPDLLSRLLWLPLQEDRKLPVWWPYARSARAEITFVLPDGYEAAALPAGTALEGPGMRFGAKWSRGGGDRELVWTALLLVQRDDLDVADYPKARDFDSRLRRALAAGVLAAKRAGAAEEQLGAVRSIGRTTGSGAPADRTRARRGGVE